MRSGEKGEVWDKRSVSRRVISSQVKCLIPTSQRAAKAVRAKTLRVLVVFCGAAPHHETHPLNPAALAFVSFGIVSEFQNFI